jgi:ATP-dependent RNA helicase DDX51/DBP6
VIDEADRLLAQSFQDWLAQVLAATRPPPRQPHKEAATKVTMAAPVHPDVAAPAFLHLHQDVIDVRTDFDERKESSCQKLLFSATLTRDPGKLAALDLREPKYFIIQDKTPNESKPSLTLEVFNMPPTLTVRE